MEIKWTEPDVECSLVVYWRSEKGKSSGSREPTLADLKRANEAAGLTCVDRDETIANLRVRIAVLEAEQAAYLDALAVDGLRPTSVLVGIDLAIERAKKAEAERDLAKHDFELANEAHDELQARFDELASSPERIALLEALEPHDPNAACAAASMKREHEAALAVLGARDGEDLLSAARRAVCLADVYRAHYRRAVISNFTTDRAMTEGLAECERLRARIAELEASAAARESLRDLMEKAAEARLSCGLYIPSDGLIASYTYGDGSNERDVLERVAEDLDDTDGAHVGAAKKGGGA